MKTTKIGWLILAYSITGCADAQTISTQRWNMNVKVLNDAGLPLADAEVIVGFSLPTLIDEEMRTDRVSGSTDTNGFFAVSHADTGSISLGLLIQKDGYYPVRVTYDIAGNYKPEKWNLNPTWTLKKIVKPIPLYAKSVNL